MCEHVVSFSRQGVNSSQPIRTGACLSVMELSTQPSSMSIEYLWKNQITMRVRVLLFQMYSSTSTQKSVLEYYMITSNFSGPPLLIKGIFANKRLFLSTILENVLFHA